MTPPPAPRRKAGKKTRKKATKKVSKAAQAKALNRVLDKPTDEEKDAFIFCRHPNNKYISPRLSWADFKSGNVEIFPFHRANMPENARRTEIKLFAARLYSYLLGLRYAGREGARYEIQDSVDNGSEPMSKLLATVRDNFMRGDS
jgi:hypothetical protein